MRLVSLFPRCRGRHMPPRLIAFTMVSLSALSLLTACNPERLGKGGSGEDPAWATYNKGYDSQRYSALNEINTTNVAQLRPICRLTLGEEGTFQTGPVVVSDTMFLTTAHTTVAINAATCDIIWRAIDTVSKGDVFPVNRGVAYFGGRIFRGTADGRLQAFDAQTGKELWTVHVGDPSVGEFLSSAPIAWNGLVFIGLAGSDWGIRGRMMAFDATTGKEAWRFWTVPTGNEPGADSWKIPESAKHGGGGTWTSYTLDPATGELFVPIGNPAPDFLPAKRPGANLYTNSVLVLDAKTGKLKWYYQLTPHDGFDWDLGAAPALYATSSGASRVAAGSKDGNLYSIDRETHKLIFKTPITTLSNTDTIPTPQGVHVCPAALGGVEWNGPAFDPKSHTLFVGAVDWCGVYKSGEAVYAPPQLYMGTTVESDPDSVANGWVTAVGADSGNVLWKYKTVGPIVAGVTATGGGLVLTGDIAGTFYAFDSKTGKLLFQYDTKGGMAGGVITYAVRNKQYIALASGNISRMTFRTTGSPTLIIMGLADSSAGPEKVVAAPAYVPKTVGVAGGAEGAASPGQQTYAQFCMGCHGSHGEGVTGPALANLGKKMNVAQVVAFVKHPKAPMPTLYPKPLNDDQVKAVAAYVLTLK